MDNRVYCKCLSMTVIEFPPFFRFSHKAHICWPPGFDKRSLSLVRAAPALSEQDSRKDGYRLNNGLSLQIPWTQTLRADHILVLGHRLSTKNNYKLLRPQMQTIMTRIQGSGLLNKPQLTFTWIHSPFNTVLPRRGSQSKARGRIHTVFPSWETYVGIWLNCPCL